MSRVWATECAPPRALAKVPVKARENEVGELDRGSQVLGQGSENAGDLIWLEEARPRVPHLDCGERPLRGEQAGMNGQRVHAAENDDLKRIVAWAAPPVRRFST